MLELISSFNKKRRLNYQSSESSFWGVGSLVISHQIVVTLRRFASFLLATRYYTVIFSPQWSFLSIFVAVRWVQVNYWGKKWAHSRLVCLFSIGYNGRVSKSDVRFSFISIFTIDFWLPKSIGWPKGECEAAGKPPGLTSLSSGLLDFYWSRNFY